MKFSIIKHTQFIVLFTSFGFVPNSTAASEAYMTIVNSSSQINGEIMSPDADSFLITEMHHLIRKPDSTSRSVHEPLIVTTRMSLGMPLLITAMDTAEQLTVTIKYYRRDESSGTMFNFYTMTLTQALIVAAEPIMLDTTSAETADKQINVRLRFSYTGITHTYEPNGQQARLDALNF